MHLSNSQSTTLKMIIFPHSFFFLKGNNNLTPTLSLLLRLFKLGIFQSVCVCMWIDDFLISVFRLLPIWWRMNTYVRIHIDTYLQMFIDINMPKFWIYIYVSCLNERTHIPQKLLYSWLQFIEMKRCISKNGQHMTWNEGGASNKFLEVLSLEKDMDIINIHRNCVSISEYCHLGKSAWSLDFSERKPVKMMHQRS